MNKSDIEVESASMDDLETLAELEAASDQTVSAAREDTGIEEDEQTPDDAEFYKVTFDKSYTFQDKVHESLDLSGLENLTTVDGEMFDRVLTTLHHTPANEFTDTTYTKHVAMRVTNLPVSGLSVEQKAKVLKEIAGTDYYSKMKYLLDGVKDGANGVESAWDQLEKRLADSDDKESYAASVKDYVKYEQETVDQQGYSVSIATKLLLGSNSNIGKENDSFFKGLDTQLNRLQNRLNKKIQKSVENGVDINTDKSIQRMILKPEIV